MKNLLALSMIFTAFTSFKVMAVNDQATLQKYVDTINSDCSSKGVTAKTSVKWDSIKVLDSVGVTMSKLVDVFGNRCLKMKAEDISSFNKKVDAIEIANDETMKEAGKYSLVLNGKKIEFKANLSIFRNDKANESVIDGIKKVAP